MSTVLFGITGSIAAYKALDVIRDLIAEGVDVIPILSKGGTEFVTITTLEALTGHRTTYEIFPETHQQEIDHIVLAGKGDLLVTCPASADIIAKYAAGIADDPLALVALAFGTPHLIAPAMNHRMWENPATRQNVKTLIERGVEFIGPDKGLMACGEEGWGRLSPLNEIHGRIMAELGKSGPLHGYRIVVSAGATKEPIDDVRYITNRSSGKMGHAVAEVARDMGADVVLVTASDLEHPSAVSVEKVGTAIEMSEKINNVADSADAIIMTAAVADFAPSEKTSGKIKKDTGQGLAGIELSRTPDILMELGVKKPEKQILVGFAAEFGPEGREEAIRKMNEKSCDLMCLNDISRPDIGFSADHNEISILYPDGNVKHIPKGTKKEIARAVMQEVARLLKEKA